MTDEQRKGIRHHFMAGLRDILVVSAVLGILGSALTFILRPYWEPFAEVPERLAMLQVDVETVQIQLNESLEPRIVEFDGPGIVTSDTTPRRGGSITVLYFLRRNASCETAVEPIWYNVNTGVSITGERFAAQRAPVTETFGLFPVSIPVPSFLPAGEYVYAPRILPNECGVYGEMRVPPSFPPITIEES